MSDERLEINDVAPSSLKHLTGQSSVVRQVEVGIEAAFADNKKFDHTLLVGPPGVGKSQLASVIAQEMATEFHEVIGQSIKSPADLNALLLAATNKAIVHIDECHEMKKVMQTALYLALDQRKVFVSGGKGPASLPVADFTLLLSTTDEYSLLQPLRDRMKLMLRFQFYSNEELTDILLHRTKALNWSLQPEIIPLIAQRSRGTPRLALRLVQSCRRVCRASGARTITVDHLVKACELEQLDDLGLGPTEQQYLQVLADGASRLNVIASMLGLPSRTVSKVIEPFLMRAGLMLKDDGGKRMLTEKGREHLDCTK